MDKSAWFPSCRIASHTKRNHGDRKLCQWLPSDGDVIVGINGTCGIWRKMKYSLFSFCWSLDDCTQLCIAQGFPVFSSQHYMTRCTLPPWLSLIFIALTWINKKELDVFSHSDYATLPFASFFLKFLFLGCNGEEP